MRYRYIIAAVLLPLCLSACGSSSDSSQGSGAASVTAPEITSSEADEITAGNVRSAAEAARSAFPDTLTAITFSGDKMFDSNTVMLFGTENREISSGAIAYSESGGLADEVSIILRTDGDSGKALDALTRRLDRRRADFEDYKPVEIGKIDKAVSFTVPGGAVLIISDSAADLEKLIRRELGI